MPFMKGAQRLGAVETDIIQYQNDSAVRIPPQEYL